MLIVVLPLFLAACGAETSDVPEDRKFANEQVTDHPPTVTSTSEVIEDATPVITGTSVTASPETLLRSRGAPHTLYTLVSGHLLAFSTHVGTSVSTEMALPDGARVLDFDRSPSGDRVAVLLSAGADASVSLAFFKETGERIGDTYEVLAGSVSAATPVADNDAPDYLVRWSPQGTGVLVMNRSMLQAVTIGSEPQTIPLDNFAGQLMGAGRSPQGSRIFLHFLTDDGSQHVFVRDLVSGKTREVGALGAEPGTGLSDLQWLPDGSGLLYVKGPLDNGLVVRGQIKVYILGQEAARLIATSGQGGPSGAITDAVVSPNGRSVAYVISVRDGATLAFHSMWVRALDGSLSYQVPVVGRGVVTNLEWVDRGIAWEQSLAEDESGEIIFVRQDQAPTVVLDPSSLQFAATPVASPVVGGAMPVGSPGASPVGSPVASPGATPVSSPQATPGATPVR